MVSAILGMGLPASASYVLVAVAVTPTLKRLGLDTLPAHFFAFFFANFSYLTPPVALSAVFASKIADSPYIKTSYEAIKAGLGGFIIPFMIVWYPVLMWKKCELDFAILGMVSCIAALISLQAGFVGYIANKLTFFERILLMLSGFIYIAYLYNHTLTWFMIAFIISSFMAAVQLYKKKAKAPILRQAIAED